MSEFEELTKSFGDAHEKRTATISHLKTRLCDLEINLSNIKEEWQLALIRELEGEKPNLSKCQKQMREIENEIALTAELLEAAETRLSSQLIEMIPALEEARNAKHKETSDEIVEQFNKLKEKRCLFLIECKNIGLMKTKVSDTERLFLGMIRVAYGANSSYKPSRMRDMPVVNLYSDYTSTSDHCAPSEHEVRIALNQGAMAAFAKWYELTGELISENSARKQLAEKEAAISNG